MPNSESDDLYESQNSDSVNMELPLLESVSSVNVNSIRSINAAIIPNPNTHNTRQLSGPLGQIREIKGGKILWIEEDPLHDAAECVDLSPTISDVLLFPPGWIFQPLKA